MISLKDKKKIKKFLSQLDKRQRAFEQSVLKKVAEHVQEGIQARAPTTVELGNYASFLSAAEVSGNRAMTAVLYTGPVIYNAKNLNFAETLIYVRKVRKETPRNQEILEILQLFQPYTSKTFPSHIRTKDFVLTWHKAPVKKVNEVMMQNRDTAPQLAKKLKPLGIKVERDQYEDPEKLKVLADLPFQVLQHEMKLKNKSKPHWTPALKAAQKKSFLKKIMKADDTVRILADPAYNGFALSGKMALKVTQQSVQSVTDFMDYLQSNNSPAKEAT